MKLSEFKNEDALELIADILEPTALVFSDDKLVKILRGGGSKLEAIKYALKEHKKEIIEILSRLEGVDPKEYNGNIVSITKSLLDITNDEELMSFFSSQGQKMAESASGSVTENTKEKGK